MIRKRPASLPLLRPQPTVIVGFDSEWTPLAKGRNRVLSYQLVVLNAETGQTSETFIRLEGATRRSRKSLTWLLSVALLNALREGMIPWIPHKLILAAHFARADLTTLRDFDEIKRRLKAIRKTYATTDKPVSVRLATPRGEQPCAVTVVDTTLQCAAKTPLEKLGDALGVPKVDLPEGYSKERMDVFLYEQPAEFERYAMTDARISALWAARVIEIMRSLGITKHVPTLGAAAVAIIQQEITGCGIELNEFLGRDKSRRGKPRPKPNLVEAWAFAAQCYHGGTNTIFPYGLSPEGRDLMDVDLKSAYVTALAISQVPDWSTARQTKDLAELAVIEAVMTFIYARFEFLVGTRFPNLPVRASEPRGLIHPLRGESWCTGPELVVALGIGAKIEVRLGWRIDWMTGVPVRPLEGYARRIISACKSGGRRRQGAGDDPERDRKFGLREIRPGCSLDTNHQGRPCLPSNVRHRMGRDRLRGPQRNHSADVRRFLHRPRKSGARRSSRPPPGLCLGGVGDNRWFLVRGLARGRGRDRTGRAGVRARKVPHHAQQPRHLGDEAPCSTGSPGQDAGLLLGRAAGLEGRRCRSRASKLPPTRCEDARPRRLEAVGYLDRDVPVARVRD
jgi:hypothetical protein